jgi:hypothetical protein
MKVCSKCKEEKQLEFFNKESRNRDGKRSICKSCQSESNKVYYKTDDAKIKKNKYAKLYKQRDYVRKYRNDYQRNRYNNDIEFRLYNCIRKYVNRTLISKKDKRSLEYVGYSPNQLKLRIEFQFREGMSWSNYGIVWEIDHKKPVTKFSKFDPRLINMLCNLQPLFISENRSKGNSF